MGPFQKKQTISARLTTLLTNRSGHDWHQAFNTSHITNDLAWLPAHTFEARLKSAVDWTHDNVEGAPQ